MDMVDHFPDEHTIVVEGASEKPPPVAEKPHPIHERAGHPLNSEKPVHGFEEQSVVNLPEAFVQPKPPTPNAARGMQRSTSELSSLLEAPTSYDTTIEKTGPTWRCPDIMPGMNSSKPSQTTWRTKNLEEDLATARSLLVKEQARSATLENNLRQAQRELAQMRHKLVVQSDCDDLLRDIQQDVCSPVQQAITEDRRSFWSVVCSRFRRR